MAKKELRLKSWDDVESALKEAAEINIAITRAENDHDRRVLELKKALEENTASEKKRLSALISDIREFSKANIKDFGDKKSKDFTYGKLKITSSVTAQIPKGQEEQILKNLKANNMLDCITVTESVNKDVLKTYGGDTITGVGAKLLKKTYYKIITFDEGGAEHEC